MNSAVVPQGLVDQIEERRRIASARLTSADRVRLGQFFTPAPVA